LRKLLDAFEAQAKSPEPFSLAPKGRVHMIDIFFVQALTQLFHRLAEALEMHDLTSTQEFDYIVHIGIIGQAQDIIVGRASFLLCCNCVRTTGPKNQYLCGFSGSAFLGSCNLISATYQKSQ